MESKLYFVAKLCSPGLEVIKLEYSLRLKIKRNEKLEFILRLKIKRNHCALF